MNTKKILIGFGVICMMLAPVLGQAEDWAPKGSIRLLIAFGAGGSTDTLGRLVAAQVEEDTGWNIVVENKPGGGGVAMLSGLMHEKPDGLTIGLAVNVPILLNLAKRADKLPFRIHTFDYLGTIAKGEVALVARSDAPFDDIQGFIALAKKKKMAIAFDAMPQQMVMTAVGNQAGVKFRFVKHKSGAEQIQSILGAHVDAGCPAGAHIKYLQSGDLKMIAAFGKDRYAYAPETKTLIESEYKFYLDPYYYLVAPKGLPASVKATLVKVFDKAIHSDRVKTALWNTLKVAPHNLGPDGTFRMLSNGVRDIKTVIDAGK
ncbi:MAG: tripartite tricarboxylate transporter substrate binding protein [Deltaproteobacteria bacterium]|nr:tripartite tricarboxylate transporter substrate binding protein [Deltaproteobacteria bacterium]MBW2138701.1 tripartite tricarboxylate transporter substrate binding protein [Deltaproteobacteria bacterium]